MATSPQYYNLIEAFPKQIGCTVCERITYDVDTYIDAILYEYVNKVPTHNAFRAARGLCNHHGWRMLNLKRGNALGVAVLTSATLDEIQTIESKASSPKGLSRLFGKTSFAALADALEPVGPCMACEYLNKTEENYLSVFVERVHEARFIDAFKQSDGLCFPHTRTLMRMFKNADDAEVIVGIQREKWAALQAELKEFMRKYDVTNDREVMGAEGNSWKRAVRYLMGEGGVFGMRR